MGYKRLFILLVTFLGGLPLANGQEQAKTLPSPISSRELAELIDQEFEGLWKSSNFAPPAIVDDALFLKRAFLDLNGTLPSVAQARDFLDHSSAAKREELVDRLLNETRRPERYAERTAGHWATLWRRMMVPGNSPEANRAVVIEPWLKKQFSANRPYDEIARELISTPQIGPAMVARNLKLEPAESNPAIFYQVIGGKPEQAAGFVTRVFLGTRIGCAECHDHPFAAWKKKDFWGTAAFFTASKLQMNVDLPLAKLTFTPENSSVEYTAAFLDGSEVRFTDGKLPRDTFADWVVSPTNKQFAATAVNRVWMYLMGRGLTDAVDDLDKARPDERQSLDVLAQRFVEAKYDLRWLIAGICKSKVYQRGCAKLSEKDLEPEFGLRVVKTLTPEQVFNSLEQSMALPVSKADASARYNGLRKQLITKMNEAAAANPDEYRAGIPQALLLMNGRLTNDATSLEKSRTLRGVLEAPFLNAEEKLNTLFIATLSRVPRSEESLFLMEHINKQPMGEQRQLAYAEIFWGLLNSPEFVLLK